MAKSSALSYRYEAGFFIFMSALAFLGRDNPNLEYPQVLYLFILLMALNLAAGVALRRRPQDARLSAAFILANCGVITAVLSYSGGALSNLWVLYILPIFTVCLLLGTRETVWITLGVVAFNGVFTLNEYRENWTIAVFEIVLKSGFFAFTAFLASRLIARDRKTHDRLEAESLRAEKLTTRLEGTAALSDAALVSAGVAHDLRNAFSVILLHAETLLEERSLSAETRGAVERIGRVAELGADISRQFALQGVDVKFEPKPGELGEIANGVAALVLATFKAKNVRLVISPLPQACPVLVSRVHLQRLFLNLLLNALSVSKDGGSVRMALSLDGDGAVAAIEDDGPGFPPELLPRLFGAYETTRAEQGGTGLGLNLCARIARDHKGALTAENRPEGGARLVLRLPLA